MNQAFHRVKFGRKLKFANLLPNYSRTQVTRTRIIRTPG